MSYYGNDLLIPGQKTAPDVRDRTLIPVRAAARREQKAVYPCGGIGSRESYERVFIGCGGGRGTLLIRIGVSE